MSRPSAYEQLTLEYINALRTDPGGEYARLVGQQANIASAISYFGVDLAALSAQLGALPAVAPLAWNDNLSVSAETHSQRMIDEDTQSHNLPGEPSLRDRVADAGYTGWSGISENIYAFSKDALHGHAGFVIDWGYDDADYSNGDGTGTLLSDWQTRGDGIQDPAGHRNALMNAGRTEIGIGVIQDTDPGTNVGEYVTTQHLGARHAYAPQFVGVVIDDADADGFYDIGEGMGGVTVTLTSGGVTLSTTTWAAGGWQIAAPAGTWTITFSGGGLTADVVTTATIGADNVKVDAFNPAVVSNTAPVVSIADQAIAAGGDPWLRLVDVMTVTDAESDAITLYELRDDTGGDNWWADGGIKDASAGYQTTDLSDIWFTRDAVASVQTLSVRAHDGTDWGAWESFELTTLGGNAAPVVTVPDQVISLGGGAWRTLASVMTVTDAEGDPITLYEVWDDEGGDNWWADGGMVDASVGYRTADLSDIWFTRDAVASEQTLWVRAFDGADWSAWDQFQLTTADGNTAPVASVSDQTIALGGDPWRKLDAVLTVTDVEDDAITLYEVWDDEGGDNWWADGGMVDASVGYRTADLSDIWFTRDAAASEQTLWVRAFDGADWSAWDQFQLTTADGNTTPVASVSDQTIALGGDPWRKLDAVLTVTDAEDDAITLYEVWDDEGGDNWWADGGMVDASVGYQTADLSDIWFTRDAAPSEQTLWVRAFDGDQWGDWDAFELFTV
ncbi:hypothetical protein D6850_12795 [Roseovarius spongiae]|uniref:SCP domain-containing protein n=1 Tax=Roseovarius spongiae TaxID=2320272 RepID=A0A3A8B8U7_9RHOB|nr:CAP domain-containing protein [Roseovarius spongiae]RKF14046.1 hypothetical protein D6850_12795 [Roseovarius spongiae]